MGSQPVVVVTVNYRLGALGFLYSKSVEGNFGVQDQILALKWVQANIGAFGGDASAVTIDGQSAGGSSVAYHLLNKGSAGLFHRAIMQSNPVSLPFKEDTDGRKLGDLFAKHLGCKADDLVCLRNASVDQVLQAQHDAQQHFNPLIPLDVFLPWTPTVGTGPTSLPQQPLYMFQTGQIANRVPLVTGVVANESMIFVYQGLGADPSEALYLAFLTDVFGIHAADVLLHYPPREGGRTILHSLSLLGTDFIMACPARVVATAFSQFTSAFLYYFDHVMSFSQAAWGPSYSECYNLTCHGEELAFIFGSAGLVIPNA